MTIATQDTALFSFSTTSAAEAAAVAEIFTRTEQAQDITGFTVEQSTFGDGVHISTVCTLVIASILSAEISEALRRISMYGTTAIG